MKFPIQNKTDTLYWFAMTWSFGTTGYALQNYMPGDWGQELRLGAALGLSAFIQTIIGVTWPEAARKTARGNLIAGTFMLLFSLSGTVLSGTLASSTNALLINRHAIETEIETRIIEKTLAPVKDVTTSALTTMDLLADYADFANREARLETDTGKSCDGVNLAAICGSICELRKRQSLEANTRRTSTKDLLTQVDDLRAYARIGLDNSKLGEMFSKANALTRDDSFREIKSWATTERASFAGAGFSINGKTVFCSDAEAVQQLDQILAALPTPDTGQLVADKLPVVDITYVAKENLSALKDAANAILAEPQKTGAILGAEPAATYAPFWAFSLMIEMICIFLGITRAMNGRLPFEGPPDVLPPTKEQKARAKTVKEVLDTLIIRSGRKTYLLVPKNGTNKRLEQNAYYLSTKKRQLGISYFPVRSAIHLKDLVPKDAHRITEATGAEMVEVYKVRKLARFERDIASVLGFSEANAPG